MHASMTPSEEDSIAPTSDLNNDHNPPLFSFGVIADIQYAPIPDGSSFSGNPRYYRHALKVSQTAFEAFQTHQMDLVVQLGDILDGKCQAIVQHGGEALVDTDNDNDDHDDPGLICLQHVQETMKAYQHGPIIHTYGNHCLYNLPRSVLQEQLHIPFIAEAPHDDLVGYYHVSAPRSNGFRFVVLDSYDIALLGRQPGTPKYDQAHAILEAHNPNFDANMNSPQGLEGVQRRYVAFNGAVGETQLAWLRDTLAHARQAQERVILLSHQPIAPESSHCVCLIWNYEQVLDIVHDYADVVVASLSGHAHKGGYHYDTQHDIHYCVIAAALESKPPTKSYAMVDVYDNLLKIRGFGDCASMDLQLSKDTVQHGLKNEHAAMEGKYWPRL